MNSLIIPLLMAFAALMPSFKPVGAQQSEPAGQPGLVVLRGHVICLDATGKRLDALLGGNGPGVRYALSDNGGKLHDFSSIDASAAIFTDQRVRQRELQVTAQSTVKHQLEIIRVQSIREGKLYDLYYFCELCNIRAYAPGLCPCCRNEMEFRETPATGN
jgi:hypothetical protein